MTVIRRRFLQLLPLAGGFGGAADAQDPRLSIQVLRDVSAVDGTNLSDARLAVIQPALEHRLHQLRTFRSLEIDDRIGPTQGILRR
jgi:hypothetical protein